MMQLPRMFAMLPTASFLEQLRQLRNEIIGYLISSDVRLITTVARLRAKREAKFFCPSRKALERKSVHAVRAGHSSTANRTRITRTKAY